MSTRDELIAALVAKLMLRPDIRAAFLIDPDSEMEGWVLTAQEREALIAGLRRLKTEGPESVEVRRLLGVEGWTLPGS